MVITGYGTEANENKARDLGVAGFLRKPLSPESIIENADRVMRERDETLEAIRLSALAMMPQAATAATTATAAAVAAPAPAVRRSRRPRASRRTSRSSSPRRSSGWPTSWRFRSSRCTRSSRP